MSRGATLIELVIVMAILGIIAAVAAIAMRGPVQGYADAARRADMTDVADTALRRMGRDIRRALPNSIRVTTVGNNTYLEFLPLRTGGRYRAYNDTTGTADPLEFSWADTSFNILGAPSTEPTQAIVANDIVVVRNEAASGARSNAYTYGQSDAIAGYDCVSTTGANCNTTKVTTAPVVTTITDEYSLGISGREFNFDTTAGRGFGSPGNRFYVVAGPAPTGAVTYLCAKNAAKDANGDALGTLTRITGYNIAFTQPTGLAGGDLLAKNVSDCSISYNPNALGYTGLVVLRLELTRGFSEKVELYHEIHVNNAP